MDDRQGEGKCIDCGAQDARTLAGMRYCEKCSESRKVSRKKRYIRLKSIWACANCGKQDSRTLSGKQASGLTRIC